VLVNSLRKEVKHLNLCVPFLLSYFNIKQADSLSECVGTDIVSSYTVNGGPALLLPAVINKSHAKNSRNVNLIVSGIVPEARVPTLTLSSNPVLFSIYISPIAHIASLFNVRQQQYADNTQLMLLISPSNI